jgi:hypothetical protein
VTISAFWAGFGFGAALVALAFEAVHRWFDPWSRP